MPNSNPNNLDDTAGKLTEAYLERSSITYLECSIQLMLSHMSKQRVVEVLRQQARIVADFD